MKAETSKTVCHCRSTRVDLRNRQGETVSNSDEIVLLDLASSEVEAGMWKDALEAAGIRSLVRPGGPGAGAWASAATFEHHVFVRADQLELARKVLEGATEQNAPLPRARTRAPHVNRMERSR